MHTSLNTGAAGARWAEHDAILAAAASCANEGGVHPLISNPDVRPKAVAYASKLMSPAKPSPSKPAGQLLRDGWHEYDIVPKKSAATGRNGDLATPRVHSARMCASSPRSPTIKPTPKLSPIRHSEKLSSATGSDQHRSDSPATVAAPIKPRPVAARARTGSKRAAAPRASARSVKSEEEEEEDASEGQEAWRAYSSDVFGPPGEPSPPTAEQMSPVPGPRSPSQPSPTKRAVEKAKADEQASMRRVAWLRRYLRDAKRKVRRALRPVSSTCRGRYAGREILLGLRLL
jgi:hypothetical protein